MYSFDFEYFVLFMEKDTSMKYILFLSALLMSFYSEAQSSVNTSGNDANGSGGEVSYSVGQVVYSSNNDATGEVNQGVQHAYEIFTVSTQDNEIQSSMEVYPNPTSDYLILEIEKYKAENLTYQIFDQQGKEIQKKKIAAGKTKIDLKDVTPSTYLIKISDSKNNLLQSFKIIKNQ